MHAEVLYRKEKPTFILCFPQISCIFVDDDNDDDDDDVGLPILSQTMV
jgi:hypothetical protein